MQVNKLHTLTGHRDCVYALTAGSSGFDIFSAAGDGMIVQWDLQNPENGRLIAKLPNSIYALHCHATTRQLIAGQNFEGLHLLDVDKHREVASLKITNSHIFDIQSYGNRIFVACGDGRVVIVDLNNWKIIKTLLGSDKSARTIAINPVAGELAVGYSDCKIRVFDWEDFHLKQEWVAHANSVFTVAYAPGCRHLFSGSRDAHLKIWDTANISNPKTDVVAHLYAINHIAFSPDGKHFVTCSMDKSIKVWRMEDYRLLKVIDKGRHAGHGTSVNKVVWTSFHSQLISASDDRTLSIWDITF